MAKSPPNTPARSCLTCQKHANIDTRIADIQRICDRRQEPLQVDTKVDIIVDECKDCSSTSLLRWEPLGSIADLDTVDDSTIKSSLKTDNVLCKLCKTAAPPMGLPYCVSCKGLIKKINQNPTFDVLSKSVPALLLREPMQYPITTDMWHERGCENVFCLQHTNEFNGCRGSFCAHEHKGWSSLCQPRQLFLRATGDAEVSVLGDSTYKERISASSRWSGEDA